MNLPGDFISAMRQLLGDEEYILFENALEEEPPVSVRLNPRLTAVGMEGEQVPWCEAGRYLPQRPSFTLDPLFHAGAYYVQEASSMFLEQVMRRYVCDGPVAMLDLCAAPGGKSTHARSLLPEGSLLVCNEVMKNRAQVLAENMTKWGHPDVVVTHSDPADLGRFTHLFDVVLTDVPCSGEGMFRKDAGAVDDWSIGNVELCRQRGRRILADVWPALKPGGLLIYSTCTYNTAEDEECVQWICSELGADVLPVDVPSQWGISGNRLSGADFPVCRFLPHLTRGEGLFMAVVRKRKCLEELRPKVAFGKGRSKSAGKEKGAVVSREQQERLREWLSDAGMSYVLLPQDTRILAFPERWVPLLHQLKGSLHLLQAGVALAEVKGRDLVPCHALAMSSLLRRGAFPEAGLDESQALAYLRREALSLSEDTPAGFVLLTYRNVPLGFVKNLGHRSNNLYPQEWRIRLQ